MIVCEPGTIRTVHFHHGRGPDGKYPVTYWGTVEEQVQEATLENAQFLSGARHEPMELFTFVDDCEHQNPEDDERFENVEDLLDEWLERNCLMGSDYPGFDAAVPRAERMMQHHLKFINRERGYACVPLAGEWRRAQDEYDDAHSSGVCMDSPHGSVCRGCLEDEEIDPDDNDSGFEPSGCVRQERARERQGEFWWLFSAERAA